MATVIDGDHQEPSPATTYKKNTQTRIRGRGKVHSLLPPPLPPSVFLSHEHQSDATTAAFHLVFQYNHLFFLPLFCFDLDNSGRPRGTQHDNQITFQTRQR
ncbi:unnamed protein product [Boreogadus saida]